MLLKKKKNKSLGVEPQEKDALIRVYTYGNHKEYIQVLEMVNYLEQVMHLTPSMKRDVLRKFDIQEVALALKLCSSDSLERFVSDLSDNLKGEFQHYFTQKFPVDKVKGCMEKLSSFLREEEGKGLIIFSPVHQDKLI